MATGLLPAAEAWFNSAIPDYFPGQTVAGFNPSQQRGWDLSRRGSADTAVMGSNVAQNYLNFANQGPQWNPYLDQVANAYTDRMNQQFSERMLPSLRGSQVASNAAGSSAAGIATTQSADDLNRTISDQLANLYARGFDTTQQNYMNTLQMGPQQTAGAAMAWAAPGVTEQQIGGNQQALQQARLAGEQQRWNYYRDAAQNRLGTYAGLLGMSPGANATNQTQTSSGSAQYPTNWGNVASGALYTAAPYLDKLFGGSSGSSGSGWDSPLGRSPTAYDTTNPFNW